MLQTKAEIKKKLTQMYQLRKQLRENLTATRESLKDVDKIVDLLTSQLEEMERSEKNGSKKW